MKKLLAMVLALCLMTGCALAAEYTWADIAGQRAELVADGGTWTLNAGPVKLWLPKAMDYIEPSQEDQEESHLVASFFNADGTNAVFVQYNDTTYASTQDILDALNAKDIYHDISEATINGYNVVCYSTSDDQGTTVYAMYLLGDGYAMQIQLRGMENDMETVSTILTSLRPADQD